jgi:uncharacterized protein YuzE
MKLHYYYDKEADTVYFSEGKPSSKDITQETSDDVLLRINPKTGKVRGFTVLNFARRLKQKQTAIALPIHAELMSA